ncbi:MAG: Polyketide cyclase / dehydrase and lipid transport [Solirubrobacteraceae bacterium]|jgi:hypothetical protein|nr:Polyketide cyclase / dehydrase and lipid transport [Solirubrobacteraceae bacterium]
MRKCPPVSSWRQQALIEAPVDAVWRLVGDPNRYPEWAGDVVAVTGLPSVAEGADFTRVSRMPLFGKVTTTFVIDALEEMKHIRLHCTQSGYYGNWVLTEARGSTFADVELGMDPASLPYRAMDALLSKRWYRRITEQSLDSLREVAQHDRSASGS